MYLVKPFGDGDYAARYVSDLRTDEIAQLIQDGFEEDPLTYRLLMDYREEMFGREIQLTFVDWLEFQFVGVG